MRGPTSGAQGQTCLASSSTGSGPVRGVGWPPKKPLIHPRATQVSSQRRQSKIILCGDFPVLLEGGRYWGDLIQALVGAISCQWQGGRQGPGGQPT